LEKIDNDEIAKDRMAWFKWNVPGKVHIWNSEVIKFIPIPELVRQCKDGDGCYNYDQDGVDRK
jgi:hypothetical protein